MSVIAPKSVSISYTPSARSTTFAVPLPKFGAAIEAVHDVHQTRHAVRIGLAHDPVAEVEDVGAAETFSEDLQSLFLQDLRREAVIERRGAP